MTFFPGGSRGIGSSSSGDIRGVFEDPKIDKF